MIELEKLTPDAFAPFGDAVVMPSADPTAADETFSFWSDVVHYGIEGETEIGYCTVYPQEDGVVSWMEKHDRSPEFLVPLDAPMILPVMTDDGGVRAFRIVVGEAVVIGKGIWHSACKPVGGSATTYFVVFRRGTPHEDVVKREIEPVAVRSDESDSTPSQ